MCLHLLLSMPIWLLAASLSSSWYSSGTKDVSLKEVLADDDDDEGDDAEEVSTDFADMGGGNVFAAFNKRIIVTIK